jgi:hypothetical protein
LNKNYNSMVNDFNKLKKKKRRNWKRIRWTKKEWRKIKEQK